MHAQQKFLVTGATGLVGNNVVRELLDQGQKVRVLVRKNASSQPFEGLNVEKFWGDIQDATAVNQACRGVDVVIHSAGVVKIGWSYTGRIREINVDGTRRIASTAKEYGLRLIHVSTVNSLAVIGPDAKANEDTPLSGNEIDCNYVVTKRAADQAIHQGVNDGLDATIVYPGMMLGPYDWKPSSGQMMLAVARSFTPVAPAGGISVSDVRDVAKAIVSIGFQRPPHRDYVLAGHNIPYFDLWTMMASVAGSRPPLGKIRPLLATVVGAAGDFWTRVAGSEPLVNSATIHMGQQFHYYDSRRAESELGYAVSDLLPTLQSAWDWLSKNH